VSENLRLTPEMLEAVLRDDNVPHYVGEEAPNFGGQPREMNVNACGGGINSFCITPEGDVQPCPAFPCSFGNLASATFTDILQNGEDVKWWQNLTLNDYEECGRYDYCAYCNLCPGNHYVEHGTPLKAAEQNCYMAKNRHALAVKMKNGYKPAPFKQRLSELETEIRPLQKIFAPSCSYFRGKRINEVSGTTSITA